MAKWGTPACLDKMCHQSPAKVLRSVRRITSFLERRNICESPLKLSSLKQITVLPQINILYLAPFYFQTKENFYISKKKKHFILQEITSRNCSWHSQWRLRSICLLYRLINFSNNFCVQFLLQRHIQINTVNKKTCQNFAQNTNWGKSQNPAALPVIISRSCWENLMNYLWPNSKCSSLSLSGRSFPSFIYKGFSFGNNIVILAIGKS